MLDDYALKPPRRDASPDEWTAYQQAYSERAMAAHRQHRQTLLTELRTKIRYADSERALNAFTQVLIGAGIDALSAAQAQFRLESLDDGGIPEDRVPTDDDRHAAVVWRDAIEAGRVELCDKAPLVSAEAFGLIDFLGRDADGIFEHSFPLSLQET